MGDYPVQAKGYGECQRQESGKPVNENVKWFITRIVIIKESQDADMSAI